MWYELNLEIPKKEVKTKSKEFEPLRRAVAAASAAVDQVQTKLDSETTIADELYENTSTMNKATFMARARPGD